MRCFFMVKHIYKRASFLGLLLRLVCMGLRSSYLEVASDMFDCSYTIYYGRLGSFLFNNYKLLCWKNTLLKRNTLLFKSLTHLAAQHTWQSHNLLLSTPCSLTPFAIQNPLLLITPCFSAHSAPQNTLLLSTLCFKEHFTPQHTLLLNTFCFLEHFAPQNTLLLNTFCSLEHFAF